MDPEAIGSSLLRPRRPRLREARSAVVGCADPQAAWEALRTAGLLPPSWLDDPARGAGFLCARCGGAGQLYGDDGLSIEPAWFDPCFACDESGIVQTALPPSIETAVQLGADPDAIAQVEALARECSSRFGRWVDLAPPRALWRSGLMRDPFGHLQLAHPWRPIGRVPSDPRSSRALHARRGALGGVVAVPTIEALELAATDVDRGRALEVRGRLMRAADGSDGERVAREARIRPGPTAPTDRDQAIEAAGSDAYHSTLYGLLAARGVSPFAESSDPWEPILAIWAMGYGLHAVARDAVLLFAPET